MVHPNRCHGPYYAYPGEGSVQMCWDGVFKITFDHCIGLGCRNSRVGLVRSSGSFVIRSKVVLLAKSPSRLATWWPKIQEKGGETWQFLQTIQVIFRLSNILTHKFPCVKIFLIIIGSSDWQGFGNLCGYTGKGWKGRGQGMECLTPHKPLPLSEGKGIPSLLPMMFVGVCHITNVLSTNKAFHSQQPQPPHCITTIANHNHLWQLSFNHLPPPLHTPMTTTGWQCHITGPICMPLDNYGEGDLARQQTCHIVYMVTMLVVIVPVHVTQGEQPDTPPPPLFI